MIFIEIALTIWLCFRFHQAGKSWVLGLIPFVLLIGAGMVIGLGLAFAGATSLNAMQLVWIDIVGVIAMIWLIIKNKKA